MKAVEKKETKEKREREECGTEESDLSVNSCCQLCFFSHQTWSLPFLIIFSSDLIKVQMSVEFK